MTIRDEDLRDRFQLLCRSWISIVSPIVEPLLRSKREFLKLDKELQILALLTTKIKPVLEYRKRLRKSIELSNRLVLFLPPHGTKLPPPSSGSNLFIPAIPDLPINLVPNALIGWQSKMETFVNKYPFDKSVFIMIRYVNQNKSLIKELKKALTIKGFKGIVAEDHNLTDDLYNPIACLLCCSKGIAVFDKPMSGATFNPNVAYELGMIHLLGRESFLLKHKSLKSLQTDILMKLYQDYSTVNNAYSHTLNWIDKF